MSGIPSWARIGAKVVCVDARHGFVTHKPVPLVAGQTYTVTRVWSGAEMVDDKPALSIAEAPLDAPLCWAIERFRPLITQQDDIKAHFKALLDVPEQVGA